MVFLHAVWSRRWVRALTYTIAVFTVLGLGAWIALAVTLRQNNIEIGDINFDFPAKLSLTDIRVKQPDITADVKHVSVDWHWGDLFSKKLSGDAIRVEDGRILLQTHDTDTTAADTTKSEFSIAYGKILIKNTFLTIKSETDSIGVDLPFLEVDGLALSQSIIIDSIINRGSKVHMISQGEPKKSSAPKSEESVLTSIPQFSIGVMLFDQCYFLWADDKQRHTLSKFDLDITSLKSSDLLHTSIQKLNLTYQDTLTVALNLNKLSVNEREEGTFKNLSLALPWLTIEIPHIQFATQPSTSCSVDLKQATVNSSLLKLISSSASSLTSNVDINFAGAIDYADNRIETDQFTMNTQGVNLVMKGFVDLPGERTDGLNLAISNVHVSSAQLANFLGVPLPPELLPIELGSDMTIQGRYDNINVLGDLLVNNTKANFSIAHQQIDSRSTLRASLTFDSLNVKNFYVSPVGFKAAHLQVKTETTFDAAFNPKAIDLFLLADSLLVNGLKIAKPDVALHYENNTGSGTINIDKKTQLKIDSVSLKDMNDLHYAGTLNTYLPHLIREDQKAGDLLTHFSGYFKQSEKGQDLNLVFDELHFKGTNPGTEYNTSGSMHLVNHQQDVSAKVRLGTGVVLDFITTSEFEKWIARADRWDVSYPETYFNLKLNVDSSLVNQFTDYNAHLEISNLTFKATHKTFESKMKVPIAKYEDFLVRNIEINHSLKDDRKAVELTIKSIQNPYTPISNVKIDLGVRSDSVYALNIDTYLPELKDEIDVELLIEFLKNGIKIVPDESKPMQFGNQHWLSKGSDGLVFDDQFEMIFSHLVLVNGHQTINALTKRDSAHITIKDFDLRPLLSLAMPDSTLSGTLNLNTSFNMSTDDLLWTGSIDSIYLMEASLGRLTTQGEMLGEKLRARADLVQKDSRLGVNALQINGPMRINVEAQDFDLSAMNAMSVLKENKLVLHGKLDARIRGTYNEALTTSGYLTLNNMKAVAEDGLLVVKADKDTIKINNYIATLHKFRLYDDHSNQLELSGHYNMLDNALDISMESQKFKVLDAEKSVGEIRGTVDVASKLHIKNPAGILDISGHVNALAGSHVTYVYTSSGITLDDRTKEVEFIAFDKIEEKKAEIRQFEISQEASDPIHYDVTLDIGSTDVTVIFSESAGEFLRMTATGNLLVQTGTNSEPEIFGKIEGQSGRLVYDLPMVSDLDFAINTVRMNWNGELANPRFSFEGSEIFRITPNDISASWQNNKDRVPVEVIAKVDDGPIENFDLHFDLRSTNSQVATWIQSQPQNTRELNAINLLVFGKINTSGTGQQGNALVQGMVTKMNELSRKKLTNTDLSFYVDTKKANATTSETVSNVGYSFSKPLFNNKFRLTLGGMLDLHSTQAAQARSSALGSIKLDYILKAEPDITVNFTKRGTYDGVINGQVDESSMGLTFMKRFKNIFYKKKSNQ
jgi:hypothetical protein